MQNSENINPHEGEPLRCWVVTDGRAGMENQCLGLAEALAERRSLSIDIKRIKPMPPVSWLPYSLTPYVNPLPFLDRSADRLEAPWPDLLIACGRAGAAASMRVRGLSGGKTFTVQTQHPHLHPARFDLVVPPQHDGLSGANVVPILGAPHRVTPAKLEEGRAAFAEWFQDLPRPLAAVLIGGSSRTHTMTDEHVEWLCERFGEMADEGIGLAATAARRTSPEHKAILERRFRELGAYYWDGTGDNPYFGLLGAADHIVVTEDSVNMVTEAARTGKPVHIVRLTGRSHKFNRFHAAMTARGVTRPFTGVLDSWSYEPLCETERVAGIIQERLRQRGQA